MNLKVKRSRVERIEEMGDGEELKGPKVYGRHRIVGVETKGRKGRVGRKGVNSEHQTVLPLPVEHKRVRESILRGLGTWFVPV